MNFFVFSCALFATKNAVKWPKSLDFYFQFFYGNYVRVSNSMTSE